MQQLVAVGWGAESCSKLARDGAKEAQSLVTAGGAPGVQARPRGREPHEAAALERLE